MSRQYSAPAAFNDPAEYVYIPMAQVESRQIAAIGHDASTETLAVQFRHGAMSIYHYAGVTTELHDTFMASESKGKFFDQHIRPLSFKKFAPPSSANEATATEA